MVNEFNEVKCPKCNSHNVNHATVGLPDAMQCLDCGYLFPQVMGLMSWPFPTKDNHLKPWTPEQVKEYNDKNTQEAPF